MVGILDVIIILMTYPISVIFVLLHAQLPEDPLVFGLFDDNHRVLFFFLGHHGGGCCCPPPAPSPALDGSFSLLHLEEVGQETLLPLLQHCLVRVHLAVGNVGVGLVVGRLLEEPGSLKNGSKNTN